MTGTLWDAPNQQVVRPDESGPWEEGDGGSFNDPQPKTAAETDAAQASAAGGAAPSAADLDAMTKADLLAYAQSIGVQPANNNMAKEELRAGVAAVVGY